MTSHKYKLIYKKQYKLDLAVYLHAYKEYFQKVQY